MRRKNLRQDQQGKRVTRLSTAIAVLLILAVSLMGQQSNLSVVPPAMTTYKTVKLADGVYAFVSPLGGQAMVTGNSLVVIGDDGVLVVDSGHFPSLTSRQIAQIRQWTAKPVRFLVNTHRSDEHTSELRSLAYRVCRFLP